MTRPLKDVVTATPQASESSSSSTVSENVIVSLTGLPPAPAVGAKRHDEHGGQTHERRERVPMTHSPTPSG